jgi:hypothetical protein
MLTVSRTGMLDGGFVRIALAILVLVSIGSLPSAGAAGEYFLTAQQKTDLVLYGRMSDADGLRYNVWIVPGFVPPAEKAGDGWRDAGEALADYGDPATYSPNKREATVRASGKGQRRLASAPYNCAPCDPD